MKLGKGRAGEITDLSLCYSEGLYLLVVRGSRREKIVIVKQVGQFELKCASLEELGCLRGVGVVRSEPHVTKSVQARSQLLAECRGNSSMERWFTQNT